MDAPRKLTKKAKFIIVMMEYTNRQITVDKDTIADMYI
jgi:hypothetical protein